MTLDSSFPRLSFSFFLIASKSQILTGHLVIWEVKVVCAQPSFHQGDSVSQEQNPNAPQDAGLGRKGLAAKAAATAGSGSPGLADRDEGDCMCEAGWRPRPGSTQRPAQPRWEGTDTQPVTPWCCSWEEKGYRAASHQCS